MRALILSVPCLSRVAACIAPALLLAGQPALAGPPLGDEDEAPATISHPVVQPTAPSAGRALNDALVRLAADPRSVDALLDAGRAATALGDNEAALGFFSRADQLAAPGSGQSGMVKAAIGGVELHRDDPVEALRWFADAEKAGADPATFALDRALAFDLVGDNAAAVAQYRKVLAAGGDAATHDEATRRMALSLAIGGDRRGAETALVPLLQRQDRAAWRTHIFVLAIAGRADEAEKVARQTMPADLAEGVAPYLHFMARLTPAQQAAVASLGRFPRAADVGRDDPRVIAYAAAHPRQSLAPAPARLAVLAQPAVDDRRHHRHGRGDTPAPVRVASAQPVESDPVLPSPPPPPGVTATATPAVPVSSTPAKPAPPPLLVAAAPTAPNPSRTLVQPGFDLGQMSGSAPVPQHQAVPQPTVLSKLDVPPPVRSIAPPPMPANPAPPPPAVPHPVAVASVTAAPQPAVASPPTITVTPAPVVVEAKPATPPQAQPGIVAVAIPPSSAITPTPPPAPVVAQVPVVQPIPPAPAKPADKPALASTAAKPAPPERPKPKDTAVAKDSGKEKGKAASKETAKGKSAKDAKHADDDSADTARSAKAKARGKGGEDDAVALEPCKPAGKANGKGRGKGSDGRDRLMSRHSAAQGKATKGKSHANSDDDTCATKRGNRPDGPADVSRDSDETKPAKNKKGDKSDKSEKGKKGKEAEKNKAHYASRIWVQVLVGADREKFSNEWRAMVKKSRKLKGHKPYITPWRSNFRLLTGPFESDAEAQDFIVELKKDGISCYEWTSPAGQAVDSLALD